MTFLEGVRVVEIGGELVEYTGRLLACLGADVIKVESPAGERTRSFGPFVGGEPDPERSLYFWQFNLGKRSLAADLESIQGRKAVRAVLGTADIVLDGTERGFLEARGLGYDTLRDQNPRLVFGRNTHFGDDGAWSRFQANDLVHLALGGVMMNCGYDADADGVRTDPPIAPQSQQSYQIAGEALALAAIAALTRAMETGQGQRVSTTVHDSVSKNTEQDVPNWIFLGTRNSRQTCRHSNPTPTAPSISRTVDGRYVLPYRTYLRNSDAVFAATLDMLVEHGVAGPEDVRRLREGYAENPASIAGEMTRLVDALVGGSRFSDDLWLDGQRRGLTWAPLRRPEENLTDAHWAHRETFTAIEHEEVPAPVRYVTSRWRAGDVASAVLRRAPRIGEHTSEIAAEVGREQRGRGVTPKIRALTTPPLDSSHERPFALPGLRVLDLSWLLASAGAGRYFTSLGAEVVKVEHSSRWDAYRFAVGRLAGDGTDENDPNRSGSFMDVNAGKRSLSLNVKSEEGRAVLRDLIEWCDVILEGFSPGTMERMGFGYEQMKAINPRIIYVQQSGMGQHGLYGRFKSYGPTAQALSGLTELSGLPHPHPPAGYGYSYLDWFGAYNMATAVAAAVYRRQTTGLGCHIDASQTEVGLYLAGLSMLEYQVNGTETRRSGNEPRHYAAAPHGAYRTAGDDRWITIDCETPQHWEGLLDVLGRPRWGQDARFATLADREASRADLDALVQSETAARDGYELMLQLQERGVPAGVCQTAEDRVETDPQLAHLGWLEMLDQRDIGRWPIKTVPFTMQETPPSVGGRVRRAGPSYAQDNEYVLREILGLSASEIDGLVEQRAIEFEGSR